MEHPNSLWRATAKQTLKMPELTDDAVCDVLVVGAGFTGLSAALELAERGTDVIVVDAVDVGWGASGRNGGQVNPMLPVEDPEKLREAVGAPYFERLAEISLGSADTLFELIDRYEIDCEPRRNGWLRVNHCAAARTRAEQAAQAWNKFGADFEFLEGDEVVKLTGSPTYRSAVFSKKGGAVQPLDLVNGLAQAALGAGAKLFANAPVDRLSKDGDQWTAHSGQRRVHARAVIGATNGYSDRLFPGLSDSIAVFSPIQIATDPLEEAVLAPVLPGGHTLSDTRRLIMYARREPDNRFVFGGIGYPNLLGRTGGYRWLLHDVKKIFPSLRHTGFKYKWGGKIALTTDQIPHLHEPDRGLAVGLGYNGRGVAMSVIMGKVLADRILGAEPHTLPFPITPIGRYPFGALQSKAAGLGMAWMRWQDQSEMKRG